MSDAGVERAGGTPGKRHRLREALLWNDPREYFEGRFLAFAADVPTGLLRAAVPPIDETHHMSREEAVPQFDLVHHQLAQVGPAEPLRHQLYTDTCCSPHPQMALIAQCMTASCAGTVRENNAAARLHVQVFECRYMQHMHACHSK